MAWLWLALRLNKKQWLTFHVSLIMYNNMNVIMTTNNYNYFSKATVPLLWGTRVQTRDHPLSCVRSRTLETCWRVATGQEVRGSLWANCQLYGN